MMNLAHEPTLRNTPCTFISYFLTGWELKNCVLLYLQYSTMVYLVIDKRGCYKYNKDTPDDKKGCFDSTEYIAEFVAAVLREGGGAAFSLPVYQVGCE